MAIFYCQMSVVSRASGRSAVAAAAYRSGETLLNERDGRVHVYEQRAGIGHSEIVLPDALVADAAFDGWALDRTKLWNAAELAEKRNDARVAREFVVALPAELSEDGRIELTRDFARVLSNRYGVAVDFAIHAPHPKGDVRNHHAHVLMTTRAVTRDGFGLKSFLEFANKDLVRLGLASTQTQLIDLRRSWEGLANERLGREGFDVRIDHRSHAERGLEIEPTEHMGVSATNVQRRGGQVDRGRIGEDAARRNAALIAEKPDQILSVITGEKSVFDRYDIARALHRYINDDVDAYTRAFASVMASPALVRLQAERVDHQTGEIEPARYSTREMVDVETAMIEAVRRMQGARSHGVDQSHVDHAIATQDDAIRRSMAGQGDDQPGIDLETGARSGDNIAGNSGGVVSAASETGMSADSPTSGSPKGSTGGLSEEQRRAIEHITGPEQIAVVVGFAGAGKSTMLAAAREAWEAQGYAVHGAALSGKAAEGLETSSGIESRTLASWDMSWQIGKRELGRNDVFVIDEAGMVGSRQLARFVTEGETRGAKIVLVGDHEQLQAIGAGAPFRAIAEETGHAELSEIRRQKVDWQREASVAFATHRTADGLALYRDQGDIHFADTRNAARAQIVRDYLIDRDARADGSRVAMAHRRVDVRAINDAIRSELQARGELARAERAVPKGQAEVPRGELPGTEIAGSEGNAEVKAGASLTEASPDPADGRGSGNGMLPGVLTSGSEGQSPMASRTDMPSVSDAVRYPDVTATGIKQPQAYLYQTRDGVREFAAGDRIVFLENSRELGVKNGMLGTITAVGPDTIRVEPDSARGRTGVPDHLSINVREYQSFDHGYATTIHKNQGATVDRAFVLASGTMDRHLTYVAMTRHRDSVQLYADAGEFARRGQVRGRSGQNGNFAGRAEGSAAHHTGRLVEHGAAAYGYGPDGIGKNIGENGGPSRDSYFVTLQDVKGEHQTVWGVDLERAMKEVRPEIGDMIGLRREGSQMIRLPDGGEVQRNVWSVHDQSQLAYAGLLDRLSRSGAKETTLDYVGAYQGDLRGDRNIGEMTIGDPAGGNPGRVNGPDFEGWSSENRAFAERRGIAEAFGIRSEIDVGRLAATQTLEQSASRAVRANDDRTAAARAPDDNRIAGDVFDERAVGEPESERPVLGITTSEYALLKDRFAESSSDPHMGQAGMGAPESYRAVTIGPRDERSVSGGAGMSDPEIPKDAVKTSGRQPEHEDKSYVDVSTGWTGSGLPANRQESADRSGVIDGSPDLSLKSTPQRSQSDALRLNVGPVVTARDEAQQAPERWQTIQAKRPARPDRSEPVTRAEPDRKEQSRDPLLERLRQQSPFEVAVDRYARVMAAIDRQLDQGLPVLEGQRQAFAQARQQLEQAQPGSSGLAASAYQHDPEFGQAITNLSGPARVRQVIASMERERQLLIDPQVRADRYIESWQDLQAERNEFVGHRHSSQDLSRVNDQMQGLLKSLEQDRDVEAILQPRKEELGFPTDQREVGARQADPRLADPRQADPRQTGRISEELQRSLNPDRRDDRERGRERDRDFER